MIPRQENIRQKKTNHNQSITPGHDSRVMTVEVCSSFLDLCQNVHHHSLETEAIICNQVQYVSTAAQVWHLNKVHAFHHICPTVPEHKHDLLLINFQFLNPMYCPVWDCDKDLTFRTSWTFFPILVNEMSSQAH